MAEPSPVHTAVEGMRSFRGGGRRLQERVSVLGAVLCGFGPFRGATAALCARPSGLRWVLGCRGISNSPTPGLTNKL